MASEEDTQTLVPDATPGVTAQYGHVTDLAVTWMGVQCLSLALGAV